MNREELVPREREEMVDAFGEALAELSSELAHNLPSLFLYRLEQAGQVATEVLDERITAWVKEDKTQQWMATEMGCSQQAVSKTP
jgi:hypothetical protein